MKEESYNQLIKHQNLMMEYKDSTEWNYMKGWNQRCKGKPYFKGLYEGLKDKFDYKEYIQMVKNDMNYIQTKIVLEYHINSQTPTNDGVIYNGIHLDCFNLLFITETYLGFLFEDLLVNIINDNGLNTTQSKYLDTVMKTDILVEDNIHLQLKNISFLNGAYCESRLEKYRDIPQLRFVFYNHSKENIIDIYSIGGEIFPYGISMDGYSILSSNVISIEEFNSKLRNGEY